ncbi:hypothetical protein WIS52_16590 [Pseudonocardia nematodicida]|uniref:Small secreted domain DUF320 n=1 Tax=Pseudonocardia nematodicida TaxID=1206997 RepID=A0ABV1KFG6_9PSEU
MLKKAGIVVAASAATLLAVSPLAFAGGTGEAAHHGGGNAIEKDSKGLVSGLSGNNVTVPVQVCNNNIPVNVLGGQGLLESGALLNGLTGALGAAGDATSVSGDSATDQSGSCAQVAETGDTVG